MIALYLQGNSIPATTLQTIAATKARSLPSQTGTHSEWLSEPAKAGFVNLLPRFQPPG